MITNNIPASTSPRDFRQLITTISNILAVESTRSLVLEDVQGEGPLASFQAEAVKERVALVPILRAGLGMVDGECYTDSIPSSH